MKNLRMNVLTPFAPVADPKLREHPGRISIWAKNPAFAHAPADYRWRLFAVDNGENPDHPQRIPFPGYRGLAIL